MKKESAFDRIRARSPLSNKVFVSKALDIADQLAAVLTERDMSQRELARLLGKGDSEVSKWLSGMHNPTLETISKLEAVLGVDLVVTKLNPDGYFNRKQLRKLPVAEAGGAHKLHHETRVFAFAKTTSHFSETRMKDATTKRSAHEISTILDSIVLGTSNIESDISEVGGDYSYSMSA